MQRSFAFEAKSFGQALFFNFRPANNNNYTQLRELSRPKAAAGAGAGARQSGTWGSDSQRVNM